MSENMYDDIQAMREEFDRAAAEEKKAETQEPAPVEDAKPVPVAAPAEAPKSTLSVQDKERQDWFNSHGDINDSTNFADQQAVKKKKAKAASKAEPVVATQSMVRESDMAIAAKPADSGTSIAPKPAKPTKVTAKAFKPLGQTSGNAGSDFAKSAFGKK